MKLSKPFSIFANRMSKNGNIYKFTIEDFHHEASMVEYIDSDFVLMNSINTDVLNHSFKLGVNVFFIVTGGRIEMKFNGKDILVEKNQLMVCHTSSIMEDMMVSPDLKCIVICLTDRLLQGLLYSFTMIWTKALYEHKFNLISLGNREIEIIQKVISLLKIYIDDKDIAFRESIIRTLIQTLLLDFCSTLKTHYTDMVQDKEKTSAERIFTNFIDILSKSENKRHLVSYYSDKLFISDRYLSSICSKLSGKSAKQWIEEYVNEDIEYMLHSTTMELKEISENCGFPTTASFSKYVHKQLGMTPCEYRNNKKKKN